ncbi:hypothetical protein [Oceanospirillum sp.]|uniref:hypothetical protein n=1 Tax=Oceanospirillum sp. TaxID=2021254 RepID=UPI003A8E593C
MAAPLPNIPFPVRRPCPQGICVCGHRALLESGTGDIRILRLTLMEEKRLIDRLEAVCDFDDLQKMLHLMDEQLGIRLEITPGYTEVRSVRGLRITFQEQRGLCRKTQKKIPAAIRRCLSDKPKILYRLLDSFDLFRAL